jgi:hypothetical protein
MAVQDLNGEPDLFPDETVEKVSRINACLRYPVDLYDLGIGRVPNEDNTIVFFHRILLDYALKRDYKALSLLFCFLA